MGQILMHYANALNLRSQAAHGAVSHTLPEYYFAHFLSALSVGHQEHRALLLLY